MAASISITKLEQINLARIWKCPLGVVDGFDSGQRTRRDTRAWTVFGSDMHVECPWLIPSLFFQCANVNFGLPFNYKVPQESVSGERLARRQVRRQINVKVTPEGIGLEDVRASTVQEEVAFAKHLKVVPKQPVRPLQGKRVDLRDFDERSQGGVLIGSWQVRQQVLGCRFPPFNG
jgi:hypothetical protein